MQPSVCHTKSDGAQVRVKVWLQAVFETIFKGACKAIYKLLSVETLPYLNVLLREGLSSAFLDTSHSLQTSVGALMAMAVGPGRLCEPLLLLGMP